LFEEIEKKHEKSQSFLATFLQRLKSGISEYEVAVLPLNHNIWFVIVVP
jgi:hypothetical protein